MANISLTSLYAQLGTWPGELLSGDGTSLTKTATAMTMTFNAGTQWAGYSVRISGTGFTYDGLPTGGEMTGLTIRDAGGGLVMQVTGLKGAAADLSAFASYIFGWPFPDGGASGPQVKNAWSLLFSGNDVITGTEGDDRQGLVGVDAGNDVFNMGGGNDRVNGGMGNDTINGGDGWDELTYDQTHFNEGIPMVRGITYNGATGTVADPYGFTDRVTGVESFLGSALADVFVAGADEITFAGLRGRDQFTAGTSGNDWLDYSGDVWLGGARGVVVTLQASVSGGGDLLGTVRDGFGNLDRTVNFHKVAGTRFDDVFNGSDLDDTFNGAEGRDTYRGGNGVDLVRFDWYFADGPQGGINVNLGRATGQIIDDGFGNSETATGIEDIRGSMQGDRITGSGLANSLRGMDGNDTLAGGGGQDRFAWINRFEIGGGDVITDFTAASGANRDVLALNVTAWGGSTTLTLVNGARAKAAVETFVFNPVTHVLSWDADGTGSGAAIDIVTLNGVTALTAGNFDLF